MTQLTNRELQEAIEFWHGEIRACYTSIPRTMFERILNHWGVLMAEQLRRVEPITPATRIEVKVPGHD